MRPICSLAVLLSGLVALGQMNTGEISGSVQDPTRSALPGATIVAEHAVTGQKFTAVSNGSGEYLFAQLPVGVYSMSVSFFCNFGARSGGPSMPRWNNCMKLDICSVFSVGSDGIGSKNSAYRHVR